MRTIISFHIPLSTIIFFPIMKRLYYNAKNAPFNIISSKKTKRSKESEVDTLDRAIASHPTILNNSANHIACISMQEASKNCKITVAIASN